MKPAIDKIKENNILVSNFGRIGIVANQTSVTSHFEPSTEVIYTASKNSTGSKVTCIFGPQHGYAQTEQDNMRETPDDYYTFADGKKVPLFSLYSQTREPTKEQLAEVDTLIVDLQDIGCRVYTYMLTLAACLRAAAKLNKRIVVLDRVNPIGLSVKNKSNNWLFVEGDRLETKWHSFVGWYDIPMRHGLTMGELGNYFIKCENLTIDYTVIPVDNLHRNFELSKLAETKWAMPSPNIPCWESAFLFPSFVSLEGTNISEGRGSTIPFQLIGSPWLNHKKCIEFLNSCKEIFLYDHKKPNSIVFRSHHFRPTFNKHTGQICHGIQIHIEDASQIRLFDLGICFLAYCNAFEKENFCWANPGYEYNYTDLPINLIYGTDRWLNYFSELNKSVNIESLREQLTFSQVSAQNFMNEVEDLFIYRE